MVGKAKKRPLGYYTYLKTLDNGGKIPTVVEVHALKADKVHSTFPELDQRQVEWFRPLKLPCVLKSPN
ncbi:hypothetical protein ABIE78_003203 [Sinorhizobium fredii]|uniref:Uncharacterized protein n=1 Tax=Sinorhizobium fredii (strain USDA 257) TaxID=1185652 RepID=I3X536_SINF2|nr:hypothetical protein USDA257_c24160 [Sinorhizobium fredii USDA 257]